MMNIIRIDISPPKDECPALVQLPVEYAENWRSKLKNATKHLIYKWLSGRPQKSIPNIPDNPKCVLVATGGNLGGAIISLPLIQGVRRHWPNAHLAIVSNRQHGLEIVKRAGLGDSFHLAPEIPLKHAVLHPAHWRFLREITFLCPDIYISNFNFGLDHTLPLRSIPVTVGQLLKNHQVVGSLDNEHLFDICVYAQPDENWLGSYWGILTRLHIDERYRPTIHVSENECMQAGKTLAVLGLPSGCVLVGIQASVWEKELFKAWPIDHMAVLCERLWLDYNIVPLIIGAPGQESLCEYLRRHHSRVRFIDGVGRFSIKELPNIVSACAAVVANDSGIMHVSVAVGTPTLAIYGMTDPAFTWVYGDDPRHRIVRRAGCKPCRINGQYYASTCKTLHCLNHISPQTILEELLAMLRSSGKIHAEVFPNG